jgi:hypothetical protein
MAIVQAEIVELPLSLSMNLKMVFLISRDLRILRCSGAGFTWRQKSSIPVMIPGKGVRDREAGRGAGRPGARKNLGGYGSGEPWAPESR